MFGRYDILRLTSYMSGFLTNIIIGYIPENNNTVWL